ncbi:hypothetical protein R0135_13875 [Congregibacter variabilis]|uniref:Uncharacterized protein n=1 Tax=Congregibacter variabilis TaxID=3081200 RepID=A0ABZ0I433_9GAMM|nr:hypothetical protein R0135_13875 [Congregibacter sp. IMCC43200]
MKDEVRKYLSYAIGELLLVVFGIFIALQIDNWNDDRKQRASLYSYLETIAQNMHEDLGELALLREQRMQHLEAALRHVILSNQTQYTTTEIFAATQGWAVAGTELFFSANTSGYDALKISPVIGRLQGTGVDTLLSTYYDTVGRIELLERSHAEYVRTYSVEVMRGQDPGIEAYAWSNPSALSPERFTELQPYYSASIRSPAWSSTLYGQGRVEHLVMLYDSLVPFFDALKSVTAGGRLAVISTMPETAMDRVRAGEGQPVLVASGGAAHEAYYLGIAVAPGSGSPSFDYSKRVADELQLKHNGGADWISVYFSVGGVDTVNLGRQGWDFSAFSTLELEMRGALGGEVISVAIKDVDDPDDRPPISVEITLEKAWRSYKIDLSEFSPADLSALNVPLAINFVPATEPATVMIRNARYR